eukprot:TRINITY_DN6336_c0_g1_i5.p1 TRINITY_DN6336_c0_g1~~TRINITY_DN6336_c0_g1_i5.p1  ORF type:complete len:147 (-),score=52.67 TRINITY_DN6336_c0_g1_i5:526-966(-)
MCIRDRYQRRVRGVWIELEMASRLISFDETGIRVLQADKFDESKKMADECKLFVDKLSEFTDKVGTVVGSVDAQAQNIENEKMKAIGLRNKLDGEETHRRQRQVELQSLINDKKHECERLNVQLESLVKIEQEQKTLIEKLSNNEI